MSHGGLYFASSHAGNCRRVKLREEEEEEEKEEEEEEDGDKLKVALLPKSVKLGRLNNNNNSDGS